MNPIFILTVLTLNPNIACVEGRNCAASQKVSTRYEFQTSTDVVGAYDQMKVQIDSEPTGGDLTNLIITVEGNKFYNPEIKKVICDRFGHDWVSFEPEMQGEPWISSGTISMRLVQGECYDLCRQCALRKYRREDFVGREVFWPKP